MKRIGSSLGNRSGRSDTTTLRRKDREQAELALSFERTPEKGSTIRLRNNNVSGTPFFHQYAGTFRLNKKQAIHNWYHLVEGYSGELVLPILKEYADASTKVYDPFGGCGTTPLTASHTFLNSYISEINPFLAWVSDVKVNVVKRIASDFKAKSAFFEEFLHSISTLTDTAFKSTLDTRKVISDCFPNKQYFDEQVLSKIALLKSLILDFKENDSDVSEIFRLALASILVPVSHMKRATDLRYKTQKEEDSSDNDVFRIFLDKIVSMYKDIKQIANPHLLGNMTFLSDDAREPLSGSKDIVDIAVTSPPYLNGTNYFRNTKLELWILDFMATERELRGFRDKSVAAGINDINRSRNRFVRFDSAESIAKKLDSVAYDSRIPKMIRSYFSDMHMSLNNVFRILRSGGHLFLDIGDSNFCGVHVPTDQLLRRIATENVGFEFKGESLIRSRRSYDKTMLKQTLLVFRKPTTRTGLSVTTDGLSRTLPSKIAEFASQMPHQVKPYSKRNWGPVLHSLCSYQSKLKPSIAHFLVSRFTEANQIVFDPFGGVGTIAFEACLQGRTGVSNDISEVAHFNALSKVRKVDQTKIFDEINTLSDYLKGNLVPRTKALAVTLNINRDIKEYYEPRTFREILTARKYYQANPPTDASRALVLSCLMHILHGNRPYALSRRSHGITPFAPTGPFVYKSLIEKLREKASRMLKMNYPPNYVEGASYNYSIFQILDNVKNLRADVIITSPPFFESTRFHTSNWLRSWFCGWEDDDFSLKRNEFLEVIQSKGLSIYKTVFEIFSRLLDSGKLCIMHLGSTSSCDMGLELSKHTSPYFRTVDLIYEHVGHSEKHGIRDQGKTKRHQFLFMQRTSKV